MQTCSQLIGTSLCWCLAIYGSITLSPIGHADIQYWIDEQGQRHFSDRPNEHSRSYQPESTIQSMAPVQLPTNRALTKEAQSRKPLRELKNRKAEKQQAKLAKRCQGYENQITKINAKLRRAHSNDQGNRWRRQRRDYQQKSYQQCRR
ncbi:MAG: DUF4124 domain-containing protein [Motiliproteus sp.]|nr:DUF4124 domain-containing protein [Motiliproteus sp.]MCW9050793.1 DUF4124 domain-containing protein [Motiliproteus sp.]